VSPSAPPILHVCHIMTADLWAGAEVQVATAAEYLVRQPGLNVSAVLFNDGWLAHELRRLGIDVAIVDERRHTAVQILQLLTAHLRARHVDFVHTHRYKDTILGTVAAKRAGVPHVIRTVHGLREPMRGWDRAKLAAYEVADRVVLRWFADRVVAVSARAAESLRHSWVWGAPIAQIHNGVNLATVRAARTPSEVRQTLGLGRDELIIGTAGRLSRVKGHEYLLRAAALILEQEPRSRFLFVGSGPLQNDLIDGAAAAGIGRACIFVDPAVDSRSGIYDLIAAMDIFVLPSLDEGLPMALLEAMALERPVVATAVGGVPEVVRHRETGLLVAPRDDRGLADACLALVLDRQWAQDLGASARRVVEREFSHEKNGQGLVDLYREVACSAPSHEDVRTRVVRRIACLAERCRLKVIRHELRDLRAQLQSAATILIVCHGNIIRSPFAARLMTHGLLGGRAAVSVWSAGLQAQGGKQPDPTAVLTAFRLGVDLRDHEAVRITPDLVARAGVIFVMEIAQLVAMRTRFPQARARTFLMTSLCPDGPLEIHDPYGGDPSAFQDCYAHIARAVDAIVQTIGS
jgi:L-malate glycosyltransferase